MKVYRKIILFFYILLILDVRGLLIELDSVYGRKIFMVIFFCINFFVMYICFKKWEIIYMKVKFKGVY